MVIAELRSVDSSDVADIRAINYKAGEKYRIGLAAEIGVEGERGADLFYFVARSPNEEDWDGAALPSFRGQYLVAASLNYEDLYEIVSKLCAQISAPDWPGVVQCLRPHMAWEFESYQP